MPEDQEIVKVVTLGFERLAGQISQRDEKVASLSEQMVGVLLKLDNLKETLANKNETDKITMRVGVLEDAHKEIKLKQINNSNWIRGLITSVILLLAGFLLNLLRTR